MIKHRRSCPLHRWLFCAVLFVAPLLILSSCNPAPEPASGAKAQRPEPERAPNILILLVDALRQDHLGVYGYPLPTSPNIDAFATGGVTFLNAFSHSTWTKPSVATLFTSAYPAQHGLDRVGFEDSDRFATDRLPGSFVTLAGRFRLAGYATAHVGANLHIQTKTGFARGFDFFYAVRTKTAFELNNVLTSWLQGIEDKPFFVYIHYMDVHWPYNRRLPENAGRFGSTHISPDPPNNWKHARTWASKHLNEESIGALRARYDQEIAFTDKAVGELLSWLDLRNMSKDTVIVLTGDHGEGFYEHGELQHGYRPFEEVTRVPLVMRLPAWMDTETGTMSELVGLVDLTPTLLDLAGLRPLRGAEGRSLAPLLRKEAFEELPVYIEGSDRWGLRNGTHKLMVSAKGKKECYDLTADPVELAPVTGPFPPQCRKLEEKLAEMRQRITKSRSTAARETVPLTEDDLEALRSLGYVQ